MKKYILFLMIIMAFHTSFVQCEQHTEFSIADSLFTNKLYLHAIEAYSRFLRGEGADYALYKIGLSKNEIAGFCVSVCYKIMVSS